MGLMVYIVEVHLEGGAGHEHIAEVRWRNPANGTTGRDSPQTIVDWIQREQGAAKVTDGKNTVDVGVVNTTPPHLRTRVDGKWTDSLLALPRY